ncbi:MAG TPA: HD-GYP domain-containing protein [Gaiellaceae bacterium]|nr:HD-GYP domain-containing protein [Gaiellaceae bacterium]
MPDHPSHTAVGGVLSQVASALERLSVETTPVALLTAAARELRERLGTRAVVVSRREGERLREVACSLHEDQSDRTAFSDYAYLLSDYPLTQKVLDTGRPVAFSLHDADIDPNEAFVLREMRMDAVLMTALPAGGDVWGLVEVYDTGVRRFDADEVALADFLVRQVGALLVGLEHTESVQRLYRETLASLANALEAKDSYTHDHTQEVVGLTLDVGRALGLDDTELDVLELGALFHDIGKIRVPEAILNKPGPLDDEEWGVMRRHTVAGESILAPITSLRAVLPIVRSSHERWDGRGYPDGLAGRQIPLGARIVSVCDAYRAMIERRSYREPMTQREALGELRDNAGTQFDPECVRALMSVLVTRGSDEEQVPLHRPAHAA